jgi:hypothetical protein
MTEMSPCPLFTLSLEGCAYLCALCVNSFFSLIPSVQVN